MSNSLDARLRGAAGALLVAAASIVFVAIGVLWFFLFFNEMSDLPRVAVLEYAIVDTGGTPENVVEHSVFLGHEALGQMPLRGESAEARHIEVLYTPQGEFRLRNVATERRLGLQYDRFFLTDRTYLLRDGDRIKLAGQTLDVALPDSDRLILTREDGATLLELPQSYYRTDALSQVWYDWISFSASLGGRLSHEPARWGERFGPRELIEIVLQRDAAPPIVVPFAELPENAVTIRRLGGQFLLSLRNARAIGICRAAGPCFELGRQAWPVRGDPVLGDLREIIVGRTTYSVDANERQLRLEPIGRAHWQTPEYVSEIRDTLPRKEDVIVDWTNTPFHRGLPAGPDAGVLAQAIGSLKTLAQFGGPVAASVPWVALGLLTLLVIIGIDEHWVRRFFVGVPNATLLTLALSPGLSTLRGLDTLAPIEILALLLAIGTILPFGVNFVVSGRRAGLGSEALFRQATQLKSSDRSAFLFLLAVTALTSVILVTSHGSAKAGNMGQNTGAAVFSVIGLFVLSGTIMTRSSRSLAFAVFWAALMVVVGLGTISLGRLALGQDMARYLELFHKHLAVLGIIAAVATWFGSLRLDVIIRGTKVILYLVTEDLRISPFQLVFAAVPAAIGALIIVPEFLVNSPPSVRVLYDGEISRLVAKATVIFAGLVILAFGTWAWYLGLRRSKEVAGKAGAAGFLHRRRNVLSPWFLIPSLVLAAVVYVTPETGIAGLQPSEATKTWLAFLFALLLARWVQSKAWRMPFEQGKSRSSILITCLLLAVVFAIGSYINFDLSPAAIVLMMAACMTAMIGLEWLRGLIPRRYLLPALVLIFGLLWFSGGGLSTPEAVVVAGLVALGWSVWTDQTRKSAEHFSPWLLRDGAARWRQARRFRRLIDRIQTQTGMVAGGAVFGMAFLVLCVLAYTDARRLGNLEEYQDYRVTIVGLELPGTPVERVMSYLDARLSKGSDGAEPLVVQYPDLSLQVRESREIISVSGCGISAEMGKLADSLDNVESRLSWPAGVASYGLDSMSAGLSALCQGQEELYPTSGHLDRAVLGLPAVQDDFAPSLLIAVLGPEAARLVLLAQTVMVAAIFALCLTLSQKVRRLSNLRGLGLLGAIFLGNLSFVLLAQIVLSWSNTLGLLPVVGQPMTFISLGASHHLFFAFPLVFSALLCAALSKGLTEATDPKPQVQTGAQLRRAIMSGRDGVA